MSEEEVLRHASAFVETTPTPQKVSSSVKRTPNQVITNSDSFRYGDAVPFKMDDEMDISID